MNDEKNTLQDALERHLLNGNVDIVDIVPIPRHGDRMVRLRTLEEALEDFDGNDAALGYLIHVKPAAASAPASTQVSARTNASVESSPNDPAAADGTYLPNGRLNVAFLIKNADLLLTAGEFALARNIYKAILQSGEQPAVAFFGLARCFEAEGKLKDAQEHYEESIAYHGTLEAYQNLASLFLTEKREKQAAETFARALHLKDLSQKQRFELHKACGNCFTRANDPEKGSTHYSKALELSPGADDIRANLGALCLQKNDFEEARKHFQDSIASNPKNAKAQFGLGNCLLNQGDKRGAHDAFARCLELDPSNASAVFHLVKCAYEIKSYATATRILEEYIEIAPVNTNLLYSLAGLQFHLGRIEAAQATVRRVLELAPTHAGANDLSSLIDRCTSDSN